MTTRRLLSLPIKGEGTPILAVDVLTDNGRVFFIADADIDCDGSGGNPEGDPWFQPDTTYHYQDEALNAYEVPFIVLPVSVMKAVKPPVLGCRARMTYIKTGLSTDCIVGDIGPSRKLGECSPCAARRVDMPPSPINGGEDDYNQVLYEVWPGQATTIDGVFYPLQTL
jgi:hypothetical protein